MAVPVEYVLVTRYRVGPTYGVHYGPREWVDWHLDAARRRGDEVIDGPREREVRRPLPSLQLRMGGRRGYSDDDGD